MKKLLYVVCMAGLALVPASATAQVGVAPQVSWADDTDVGIGGRLTLRLPTQLPLEVTGAFDFFFPDEDVIDTYWEANANVNYLVQTVQSLFVPYVGAGLNVARLETASADDTQIGLNLLGGVRYAGTPATPYGEVRFEVDGGEQVVFTVGLIVNVGPGL